MDLLNPLVDFLPPRWRLVAASQSFQQGLPVDERIILLRNVPAREMPCVYRACDLLAFPSRAEACPFVTKEAMACGLPVVTTTAGTGEELQQDPVLGRWVIDCPPTFGPLRERVLALLDDAPLREQMGRGARDYAVAHFSVEAFNAGYRSVLDHLVPRQGVTPV